MTYAQALAWINTSASTPYEQYRARMRFSALIQLYSLPGMPLTTRTLAELFGQACGEIAFSVERQTA